MHRAISRRKRFKLLSRENNRSKQGNRRKNENYGNFIKPIIDSIKLGLNYGKTKYNGNEYEGEYANSLNEGKGKITEEKSGEFYFGAWKD